MTVLISKREYDKLCHRLRNLISIAKDVENDMEHRINVMQDLLKHHKRDRMILTDRIKSLGQTLDELRADCESLAKRKEKDE